jgi:hypothetical protein
MYPNNGDLTAASANLFLGYEGLSVMTFTEAKAGDPTKNEDLFRHDGRTFVLADGSTPKLGNAKEIQGRSGGAIAADLVTATVMRSEANGRELVDEVTAAMQAFYAEFCPDAVKDPRASFATTFVAARIAPSERGDLLVVTQVGDTGFRINGGELITEEREQDKIDAEARAAEIKRQLELGVSEDEAVRLGRKAIEPSLNEQWKLWNNANHPQGFGYVNGHPVPDKFIHVYELPMSAVHTLEEVTDGYPKPAAESTITSWEQAYAEVQGADPQRYLQYLATKPADDRTVAVIRF